LKRMFMMAASLLVGITQTPARADFAVPAPPSVSVPAPHQVNGGAGQPSAGSLPIGVNYRIHPGDELSVQVYADQSLSQNTTVLPDGSINYPLVGRIDVRGSTTDQAAAAITRQLQRYVRHPNVTVSIVVAAQYSIQVLGNVKNPGKYVLRSDARVSDAIAAAGGLAPFNGSLPPARISLGTRVIEEISLQRLLHDGDASQNVLLEDGSVVYVPNPNTFDVEVVGAVDHPGNVTLSEGDRLSMAIAKAGNSQNSSADLNHVHITLVESDGKSKAMTINLYNTLVNGDLHSDVSMQKGDVVYVPIAKGNNRPPSAASNALLFLGRLVGLPTY